VLTLRITEVESRQDAMAVCRGFGCCYRAQRVFLDSASNTVDLISHARGRGRCAVTAAFLASRV
jgi:hypothetical protein